MPAGRLVTVPMPAPDSDTASVSGSKRAVTLREASIVTLHVGAVPEQSPAHPAK
jgi:hypothetical protein